MFRSRMSHIGARFVIPAEAGIQAPHGFRVPLRGPGMTGPLRDKSCRLSCDHFLLVHLVLRLLRPLAAQDGAVDGEEHGGLD